jgi:hypothetical protein
LIRELNRHEIPWLYFASLETGWLQVLALCLVDNAAALTDTKTERTRMAFSSQGVYKFLQPQVDPFSAMCAFTGVTREEAEGRFRDVCVSFGFGGWGSRDVEGTNTPTIE